MQASAAGCVKPKYSDSTLPQTIICNTWIDVNNANQDQNPSPLVQHLPFIGQYGQYVCGPSHYSDQSQIFKMYRKYVTV